MAAGLSVCIVNIIYDCVLYYHNVLFSSLLQAHSSVKAMQKDVVATRVESAELNARLVEERGNNEALRTQLKKEVRSKLIFTMCTIYLYVLATCRVSNDHS